MSSEFEVKSVAENQQEHKSFTSGKRDTHSFVFLIKSLSDKIGKMVALPCFFA